LASLSVAKLADGTAGLTVLPLAVRSDKNLVASKVEKKE
jgi:hypothetical protein